MKIKNEQADGSIVDDMNDLNDNLFVSCVILPSLSLSCGLVSCVAPSNGSAFGL
jgi:hypothetical protein